MRGGAERIHEFPLAVGLRYPEHMRKIVNG